MKKCIFMIIVLSFTACNVYVKCRCEVVKDFIKLDKITDSTLIKYVGKNKIDYCEGLYYLANSNIDITLHTYFYMENNYKNFKKFIYLMQKRTKIKANWELSFIGPFYFQKHLFYRDVLDWTKILNCEYSDSTEFFLLMDSFEKRQK